MSSKIILTETGGKAANLKEKNSFLLFFEKLRVDAAIKNARRKGKNNVTINNIIAKSTEEALIEKGCNIKYSHWKIIGIYMGMTHIIW